MKNLQFGGGLVSLSETSRAFRNASEDAFHRASRTRLFRVFWNILGAVCAELALVYSSIRWRWMEELSVSTEECNVRQMVYRTAARLPWRHNMLFEAEIAIAIGLQLVLRTSDRSSIATRLNLILARAELMLDKGEGWYEISRKLRWACDHANETAARLTGNGPLARAVRAPLVDVYRRLALLYGRIGGFAQAEDCCWRAATINEAALVEMVLAKSR